MFDFKTTSKKMHMRSQNKIILFVLLSILSSCDQIKSDKMIIDIVFEADHILTMNNKNDILTGSAIAIDDGIIIDIDTKEAINKNYSAEINIAGEQRIIMPGLINGHSHAAMTLLRGIADDKKLIDWLNNYIFPLEQRFVSEDKKTMTGRALIAKLHSLAKGPNTKFTPSWEKSIICLAPLLSF